MFDEGSPEPIRLSAKQLAQLVRVSAAHDPLHSQTEIGITYRPCAVTMLNRERIDRVYVMAMDEWISVWGFWPEAELAVDIESIVEIRDSPFRLPAEVANEVYRRGENADGFELTFCLRDGRRIGCHMGGAIDFPPLPAGALGSDIVRVELGLQSAEVIKQKPVCRYAFFEKRPDEPHAPRPWRVADSDVPSTPEEARRGGLDSETDARLLMLADDLRAWMTANPSRATGASSQVDLQRFLLSNEMYFRDALGMASWMTVSDEGDGYLARHPDLEALEPSVLDHSTEALDLARFGPPGDQFRRATITEEHVESLIKILNFAKYLVASEGFHEPQRLGP